MTKILVTGCTGFVGSHLADYVLENHPEVEIVGLKRWRSPIDNIEHIKDKLTLLDCDLTDLSSLIYVLKQVKPDKIFHLAAQSYVPYSYIAPIATLEANVLGTCNLLEAMRIIGIDSLIHICSSSEVYGQVDPKNVPIKEDCPFNPASPYAVSKVAEDMLGLQYYTAYGLKTVRTRMFTHTGPRRGEVFVASNWAKQIAMIEAGKQKPEIHVGNLESVRTFADVRDTVRAYWLLDESMAGEVFNIGGLVTMTVGEMLYMLISIASLEYSDIKIVRDESRMRPADVTLQVPCIDKFVSWTGWQPQIPFRQTLSDLLSYWRERI